MTPESFVKQRHPKMREESHKTNGGQSYWLIREIGETMYFCEGKTRANAWRNAKEIIEFRESQP